MLTPLQLRLCGLSAMAPALTEAASQAPSFKLPYTSPSTVQSTPGVPVAYRNGLDSRECIRDPSTDCDQSHLGVGLLTPKRLALSNNNNNNKGHLSLSCKEIGLNFTNRLVGLRDQPTVDATIRGSRITSISHLASTIGLTSELCKREIVRKEEGPAEVQPRDGALLCTMNNSNKNLNNLAAVNTMGMLKTATKLKFSTADEATTKTDVSQATCDTKCPVSPLRDIKSSEGGVTMMMSTVVSVTSDNSDRLLKISKEEEEVMQAKEGLAKTRLQELNTRQVSLERRADCLFRRIQKLQARQVEKHVSDELSAFVEYHQKALEIPSKREKLQLALIGGNANSTSNADIKAEILQSEDVKNLSTAALVNLVRKLESSHGSALRQKYVTLQQIRASDKVESTTTAVKLSKDVCSEMDRVAGTLQSNLRHLENTLDSDATESSSGGESCDEMDGYDDKKIRPVPIMKRAAWKYSVDRAGVASRWTWLQAQVSDLEYRIRQQNEIYRQLRASKAPLVLAESSSLEEASRLAAKSLFSPSPSRLGTKRLNALEGKAVSQEKPSEPLLSPLLTASTAKSLLVQPLPGRHPAQINGYVTTSPPSGTPRGRNGLTDSNEVDGKRLVTSGSLDSSMAASDQSVPTGSASSTVDLSCTASRTRPLKPFRKRKLLRSVGLYHVSRKAAKLSNVRCGCLHPATPCIMCGGRVNNIQVVDSDTMPIEERIALLDPTYHPVLSLEPDVPLSLRFESLMKNGDWQKMTQKPKPIATARKKSRLAGAGNDVHKHSRKLKKNAAATLTAKLKKKLTENKRPRGRGAALLNQESQSERMRKKQIANLTVALKKQRERSLSGSSGSSSKPASPVPSLSSQDANSLSQFTGSMSGLDHKDQSRRSSLLYDASRRRRGESAFDINNIVIPYSMAAATRVERLQYKEILTPKWRLLENEFAEKEDDVTTVVHKTNGLVSPTEEDETEDLAEDAITIRHDRCEQEEKKRFMSYLQTNWNARGRSRNVRSDSRADSSGANTPDPMSPYPLEHHDSPLTTPPSTPAPVMDENGSYGTRRRTTSLSKRDRIFEDYRTTTPDIEEDPIPPWDLRTFPLSDEQMEEMVKEHSRTPPPASPRDPSPERQVADAPLEETKIEPATSRPLSPMSTSSASVMGEDPNDPEWTVSAMSAEKGPRPGIVIKLAKR